MARVLADDPQSSATTDVAALEADLLDGSFDTHRFENRCARTDA
jgi:hypothetical protein